MAIVRFVAPISDLELPVGKFVDYVFDVEDTDELTLSRIRWQGSPYGVRELGTIGEGGGSSFITESMVASGIRSPSSPIGSAVSDRLESISDLDDDVALLRSDVNTLLEGGNGGGGGIVVGNELPNPLESGAVAARLRTY